jgi:hypothetical protein
MAVKGLLLADLLWDLIRFSVIPMILEEIHSNCERKFSSKILSAQQVRR